MKDRVRLAAVQPLVVRPESANVERAVFYARQAAEQGAQVVVFPECYPGPFSGPPDFSAADALAAVARQYSVYLGYGFMEPIGGDGPETLYHNIYQVLGPDGAVAARYAKMIPAAVDPAISGKRSVRGEQYVLLETPWARLGLLICWEAWFPELCRTLAMRGADIVLFPTGGMLGPLAPVWHNLLQARATENLVYTVSCVNLFGTEDGFGHICGPEGEVASALREGVLAADLDIARLHYLRAEDEQLGAVRPYNTIPGLWRYNRPELYGK
jgi:predicted amidohydrolase